VDESYSLRKCIRPLVGDGSPGHNRLSLPDVTIDLLVFCNGRLKIDNNAAERALRAVALGRKNYLLPINEIRQMLRHKDMRSTQRYTHAVNSQQVAAQGMFLEAIKLSGQAN